MMIFSVNTACSRRGKEELEKQLTLFEKTRPTAVAEMMDGRAGGTERMTTASAAGVRRREKRTVMEERERATTQRRRSERDRDGGAREGDDDSRYWFRFLFRCYLKVWPITRCYNEILCLYVLVVQILL